MKDLNCVQVVVLIFFIVVIYLLSGNYSEFDKANDFISAFGTLVTGSLMYLTLSEMKKQFIGNDKPVIVLDDVRLCGSEHTIINNAGLTRPNKFIVKFTFSNWGDAAAFNVLIRAVYTDSRGKEDVSVLNWKIKDFSVVGKGREKSVHEIFELDVAQQICDEVHYSNKHNPVLRVETYYRNLHGQWFRNIQLFELKEVCKKLDNGNNHLGEKGTKLSNVRDFSFYVVEHNGKNTGCKEISYRDVEIACGFKNGIITEGK